MGPGTGEEFGAALAGQAELEPILERWADEYRDVTAEAVADSLGGLVSDVDRAVLTGEFAQAFVDSYQEGARTGIWGWYDDDIAFTVDWGLDLASIHVPVTLWQGHQDLMVPPAHGRWLAEHVARARARMEPDHRHPSPDVGSFGM